MTWVWQHPGWPSFTVDRSRLQRLEARFLQAAGRRVGSWRHLQDRDRTELRVQWLSTEAFESSAIEGEILDRASLQSSIRRHFGLDGERRTASSAEVGMADMMMALFSEFDRPLDHDMLRRWHRMLMGGQRAVAAGAYRRHPEAMQIVSGPDYAPRVHYEAPPSRQVEAEMDRFLAWYAGTESTRDEASALTRAGTAHLYFVCIHPFEDGNGRIGRALAEKSLAQSLGEPSLIALSRTIARRRKAYYAALEGVGPSLDITDWLVWFAGTVVDAQLWSERRLVRSIQQAQFFERLRGELNRRQEKALLAMFRAEPDGFEGGLSSGNYRAITRAPASSATRDLADLVAKGALRKSGERRYTRYWLNLPPFGGLDEDGHDGIDRADGPDRVGVDARAAEERRDR